MPPFFASGLGCVKFTVAIDAALDVLVFLDLN